MGKIRQSSQVYYLLESFILSLRTRCKRAKQTNYMMRCRNFTSFYGYHPQFYRVSVLEWLICDICVGFIILGRILNFLNNFINRGELSPWIYTTNIFGWYVVVMPR